MPSHVGVTSGMLYPLTCQAAGRGEKNPWLSWEASWVPWKPLQAPAV